MKGMIRLRGDAQPRYCFRHLLGTSHATSQKGNAGHEQHERARAASQEGCCGSGGTKELPVDDIR